MIRKAISAFCILVSAPATGQIVYDYDVKSNSVDLTSTGTAKVDFSTPKHLAIVELTVVRPPRDWPKSMRIGPSAADVEMEKTPDRMIVEVAIRVDGCLIDQHWPKISGLAVPNRADLKFIDGHWQLSIFGGDGAESYAITYAFDNQRILARDLSWGPGYEDATRYDISTDPDVFPRDCISVPGAADHQAAGGSPH